MNVEQSFFFRRRLRYRRNRFWKFVEYARTWTGCIKWSSNLATHRSIWFLFVRLMKEYLYYCFFKNKNNIISSNALVYIFNNWRFDKNKKFKIIYNFSFSMIHPWQFSNTRVEYENFYSTLLLITNIFKITISTIFYKSSHYSKFAQHPSPNKLT